MVLFLQCLKINERLMTEKFDGVRLFWNGSSFYTRHGRRIAVPSSISSVMPDVSLDGELW